MADSNRPLSNTPKWILPHLKKHLEQMMEMSYGQKGISDLTQNYLLDEEMNKILENKYLNAESKVAIMKTIMARRQIHREGHSLLEPVRKMEADIYEAKERKSSQDRNYSKMQPIIDPISKNFIGIPAKIKRCRHIVDKPTIIEHIKGSRFSKRIIRNLRTSPIFCPYPDCSDKKPITTRDIKYFPEYYAQIKL